MLWTGPRGTWKEGSGYEKEISFGVLVQLLADALLAHQGRGRRSFVWGENKGCLPPLAKLWTKSWGGCERACPGSCGASATFSVGTLKGVGRVSAVRPL